MRHVAARYFVDVNAVFDKIQTIYRYTSDIACRFNSHCDLIEFDSCVVTSSHSFTAAPFEVLTTAVLTKAINAASSPANAQTHRRYPFRYHYA